MSKTIEKCMGWADIMLGNAKGKVRVTIVNYKGSVVMNYVKSQCLC